MIEWGRILDLSFDAFNNRLGILLLFLLLMGKFGKI